MRNMAAKVRRFTKGYEDPGKGAKFSVTMVKKGERNRARRVKVPIRCMAPMMMMMEEGGKRLSFGVFTRGPY